MSVVARLEVIPARQGSMSDAIASAVEALDEFDVSYETTPTDTVIEADDPAVVFEAAAAAHRAVADDRVITSLEVDHDRTRTRNGRERVEAVERQLGRPARRERRQMAGQQYQQSAVQSHQRQTDEPRLYGGPWQPETGRQTPASPRKPSRYLRQERPVSR